MRRLLLPSLMAATLLVTAGAASSFADTVTFNNSALHPDGTVTVGNTISFPDGVIDTVARVLPTAGFTPLTGTSLGGFASLSFTSGAFIGPDASTPGVNDYDYTGGGSITIRG